GTKGEADLMRVYRDLLTEYQPKLNYWASTTYMAGPHEMQELFDDRFMDALDTVERNGGDFVKLFNLSLHNRYKSLLRKLKTRRSYEQYEVDREGEEEAATSDIADDFNLAEEVTERLSRKKKNDQRMLIEFLVSGENARTTAIVQTFLSTELKTPTAIGKHLGLDHKQVSRALTRLQAKYSTKQFGDYTEYLMAL
ncbi:MAG: sigma-70 family RNA polymerase sigma factor, partial [Bacillales bacterium]